MAKPRHGSADPSALKLLQEQFASGARRYPCLQHVILTGPATASLWSLDEQAIPEGYRCQVAADFEMNVGALEESRAHQKKNARANQELNARKKAKEIALIDAATAGIFLVPVFGKVFDSPTNRCKTGNATGGWFRRDFEIANPSLRSCVVDPDEQAGCTQRFDTLAVATAKHLLSPGSDDVLRWMTFVHASEATPFKLAKPYDDYELSIIEDAFLASAMAIEALLATMPKQPANGDSGDTNGDIPKKTLRLSKDDRGLLKYFDQHRLYLPTDAAVYEQFAMEKGIEIPTAKKKFQRASERRKNGGQ